MSVNSVSTGVLPPYSSVSGSNSQAVKAAAFAKELPERTSARADTAVNPELETSADNSPFQSDLERARLAGGATAGAAKNGASGAQTDLPSPGIALYKRVSQIGSDETPGSELLRRWNSIVQSEQDTEKDTTAGAFSQNNAARFQSGILDLTA